MTNILIAYETWAGATHQAADIVADALRADGSSVDVRRVGEVKDASPYDAIVLGTSVHAGRVPRAVPAFAKRNRAALAAKPVACFVVCLTMCEDTPENRATATAYLDKVREVAPGMQPVDIGLFAGALITEGEDFDDLNPLLKGMVNSMAKNQPEHRELPNPDAIRAWAETLPAKLEPAARLTRIIRTSQHGFAGPPRIKRAANTDYTHCRSVLAPPCPHDVSITPPITREL